MKVKTSVSIDYELLKAAHDNNANISELVESLLSSLYSNVGSKAMQDLKTKTLNAKQLWEVLDEQYKQLCLDHVRDINYVIKLKTNLDWYFEWLRAYKDPTLHNDERDQLVQRINRITNVPCAAIIQIFNNTELPNSQNTMKV